jgi:eukaryotic-like serine/threonine-protein kinase
VTLSSGARLGPYEIVSPLGAGGMGEVYRAMDTRLGRDVAIKVLSSNLSSSPELRQRFEREARTISQLSHPHICALYDVGREGETEFLVMEYLDGETLADRLARGPLPIEQTLRFGIEIADALDKAHRQGIVHRDLKPGNVMLTKSGVKLLDFGLARLTAPPSGVMSGLSMLPTTPKGSDLTAEGTILGTLQYMAPEQLEGKEADGRTDIFALGCVLYEMVTSRKAFAATSQASLIGAILHKDPEPISQFEPMTPRGLDRAVRRCLAKDPEARWQSARDLALELAEATRPEESAAPTSARRQPRSGTLGWAVAAALVLGLIGILAAPWRPRSAPPPATKLRFTIPPPPESSFQGMLALSPKGEALALVVMGSDGRDRLWIRSLDSLEARPLEGTEGAEYPFWSPDGRSLAFFAYDKLKRIEISGGSPRSLCDARTPRGGSWSSSGVILFSANVGSGIEVVSEAGGEPRSLAHLTTTRAGGAGRWPSFLPDGRHFLYQVVLADPKVAGLYVGSLDSTETTRIAAADSGALYAPPGYLLYRSGDRLVSQAFDPQRLRFIGDPLPLVEDVWWDGNSTLATAFSVSANGVIAYQTGGLSMSRLVSYDRSGKELGAIGPPAAYFEPVISPDGRWLVVSRADPKKTALSEIWTADLVRATQTRFSDPRVNAATAIWSPDGRRIAFSAITSGEVLVKDAHSAGKPKLLFQLPAFSPLDDWSRDGRYIFYEAIDWKTFHFDIGVRDLQTGTSRPLIATSSNEFGAALSSDGRWIAYQSDESGTDEIYVQSFPAGNERQQVSTGGGTQPRWRRDGRELFYVSFDRKVMTVDIPAGKELEAGKPHALFQTRILPLVEARNHYDVTPDGQRFVINSRRREDANFPITVVVGWEPEPKK